jgi:hypothetical protein
VFDHFNKTYRDRTYKFTTMVRHKGTLIAFAMDDKRRIVYSVLDLAGDAQTSVDKTNDKSPFDNQAWAESPTELIFPTEIAEVGFGVADQTMMPVVKKNSTTPEAFGTLLPAPGSEEAAKFDYFLSTTARLGADAPFQVLSDGQFLYLFRQAIAADHAEIVTQRDKDGKVLLVPQRDKDGKVVKGADDKDVLTNVPLVNATLLVDRFVLVGTQLKPRMEVRYQRSRSKTRPANRKDSLGPKDLDGNVFFEPTQELRFIGDVAGGRFTALLLPTAVAETQRWQIFVCRERKDAAGLVTDSWMDSFNIERAADGLFNTLGTQIYTCVDHPQLFADRPGKCALPSVLDASLTCDKALIPRLATSGYAESALKFTAATNVVELTRPVTLGTNFTLEAWIKPEAVTSTAPQVFCSGTDFSLSLETNSRLLVKFNEAQKATSDNVLTPGKWIHIAVTFDGATCRFYANGKPAGESQELSGKATASTSLQAFGAKANAYRGTIDEIRVWRRVRSGRELRAGLHQRLTGLEPGLTGYWRLDEGAGTKAFDQTTTLAHGTITGATWTPSDAPVGEHPGIERSSLRLSGRNLASGPTALLYFQQTKARTGYDRSQEKQLKQSGRVMLAVATRASGENKDLIAALDFGVSATGRLAQIPDNLTLQTIQAETPNTKPLHEQLAALPEAEKNLLALRTAFTELRSARVTVFSKADPLKIGIRKQFRLGEVPTGIVTAKDINPNTMEVDAPLKAIHNEANDTWTIEISAAHRARLRAAEPDEPPASLAFADIEQRINAKQNAIHATKALVKDGFKVTMPLVRTDALGLTITGGVLGFAWTNDAPLLFDSATGSLALYFRGSDDQFFVTYYTTLTTRATYPLKTTDGAEAVKCLARSSEAELEKLTIAIVEGANADLCTVTITVPDTTAALKETWRNVPRDAQNFARVLNGLAGERAFLGSGQIAANGSLTMTQGLRRGLAPGTTLMVGETRVQVREKANPDATRIALDNTSAATSTETLPVFFLAYDYLANAAITDAQGAAVPSDLYNGSRLIVAVPSDKSEHRVTNQTATSGATITCQWTAAAPGTTLVFDGKTGCAQAAATKLGGFNATGDLTLEAWVRPGPIGAGNKARVIHHRTAESQYALGLQGQELHTALTCNGTSDGVSVAAVQGLPSGNTPHTLEAWVRPTALPPNRSWLLLLGNAGTGAHHWLLNKEGQTQFGVFNTGAQIAPKLALNQWSHLASSFDGTTLRVYVNGVLAGEVATQFGLAGSAAGLPLTLAQPHLGEDFFAGQMDEVRVWKRARTQGEIVTDMNRRLGGKETDLVGYWHFDGRAANDFARHQTHGKIVGAPTQAVSPLTAYSVFAGVGAQVVQGVDILPTGNWTHLAATFKQAYGLAFDGVGHALDAGTDLTLDINRDLTLEVFLHLNANGKRQTLLTRGTFHNQESDPSKRASQHPPYALLLDEDNKLIFAFEDVEQNLHEFKTTTAVTTGFHRLAVTRERQSMSQDDASEPSGKKIVAWDAIKFYVDKVEVAADKKRHEDVAKSQPLDVGNSNEALTIGSSTTIFRNGTATVFGFLNGTISEIRLWNVARDAKEFKLPNPKPTDEREARTNNKDAQLIGKDITGNEKGLVAWWRFSEGSGNRAFDSKGQNHATINGATWVKSPNPEGAPLKLYINGQYRGARLVTTHPLAVTTNQFTLGALKTNATLGEFFPGEMEEVRIWQRTRTQEQIQDNLFRRLLGEREDLIACYTFTPDAQAPTRLNDDSPRGNHLTIQGAALVFSTAPIGDDIPQVRSALAGVKTTFNDLLHSTPALQEYGDLQFDSQGNMIGVYKRCYGFIKNGEWQLVTGFKVGDLVMEWIGQAQFAPQLIGFIEGAPPVPSENLTQKSDKAIGDLDDYNEASTIEIVEADETTFTYAASKAGGFDMSLEASLKFGVQSDTQAGPLAVLTKIEETKVLVGPKTSLEFSAGWKEDANTSVGQTTAQTTSMELRGRFTTAEETAREERRRFVPDNVGLALVKSETADVFALRLKHNNALIAYQMRPNPDIPKDWNIIHFPINPRYTKQGTLDGKLGMTPDGSRTLTDVDYPQALNYSSDSSYFKPLEAYALKNRIQQSETALKAYYEQYAAHLIGQRLPPFNPGAAGDLGSRAPGDLLKGLPQLHKRNIVNTYVWTADGGLFAETQETMDSRSETFGGEWSFQQLVGLDLKVGFFVKVGMILELSAMVGGHLNLEVTKTQDAKKSFGLNVSLGKVERDIYLRSENEEIAVDTSDPLRPKPKKQPGKVDAYRFLSFYLEAQSEHHDQFYARVVDPLWLEQSDEPGAVALRAARQPVQKPACWRVLHRVTYVSRVLPPLASNTPASPLEKTLQTLDIASNYELIKQLEPFVSDKLTTPATFTDAVCDTLTRNLPELLPHLSEIEQYLRQYFELPDLMTTEATSTSDDPLGLTSRAERAPNQPPLVSVSDIDEPLKLNGLSVTATLKGSVSDDRINQAEALFVTWEKIAGDGVVTIANRHLVETTATFPKRGVYALRLTASDGQLSAHDTLTVTVNEPPTLTILAPAEPQRKRDSNGKTVWEVELEFEIATGLGDPKAKLEKVEWSKVKNVEFATGTKPTTTQVTFKKSGSYLLTLTVDNGSFTRNTQVVIEVAARVKEQLQALYTFEEREGESVLDVSGNAPRLNLVIHEPANTQRVDGGLALRQATSLTSREPLTELTKAMQASNEITLEAWLKPRTANVTGLRRIITCSNGPAARNFTLGQLGRNYYVGLRTTTNHNGTRDTDSNASRKALVAGTANISEAAHLVCTRDHTGLTVLYVNGEEVGRRRVSGEFSAWDSSFPLALGNEIAADDGHDRAWQGEFHLVALYSRALSAAEVTQNFEFGKASDGDAPLPPIVSAGADRVVQKQGAAVAVQLEGRITTDRPSSGMIVNWTQVSGPESPNENRFANLSNPRTMANFTQEGRYVLRLTVDDGEFLAIAEAVVVIQPQPISEHLALTESSLTKELKPLVKNVPGLETEGVTYRWQQTSGPASLTLTQTDQLNCTASVSERGVYGLLLQAEKAGRLWNSIPVTLTVHQRPVLNVGTDQLVTLPTNKVTLPRTAAVTDNGLGHPQSELILTWEAVPSTPNVVLKDEANTTTATFSQGGVYQLRCTATNPHLAALTTSAEIAVIVNQSPVVKIAPAVAPVILLRNALEQVKLEATVSDDGLPNPEVSLQWARANGAGGVSFTDAAAAYTTAIFSAKGVYDLQLTAHDGVSASRDTIQFIVHEPPSIVVDIPSQTVRLNARASLRATITDTGLAGTTPGQVTTTWTKSEGPEDSAIADPTASTTSVTFDRIGEYTFTLVADNGLLTRSATVQVTVRR